jgi:hypothetical protein
MGSPSRAWRAGSGPLRLNISGNALLLVAEGE